jgi:hypothetical protein
LSFLFGFLPLFLPVLFLLSSHAEREIDDLRERERLGRREERKREREHESDRES